MGGRRCRGRLHPRRCRPRRAARPVRTSGSTTPAAPFQHRGRPGPPARPAPQKHLSRHPAPFPVTKREWRRRTRAFLTKIIRTAELSVVIPRNTLDERFAEVVDAAERNGGFVSESLSRTRTGNLTLRVPAGNLAETLRAVRRLGTVDVESVRGKDVTANYVDLRARLSDREGPSRGAPRAPGGRGHIEQTIRVQNELDETQLDIEAIQDSSGARRPDLARDRARRSPRGGRRAGRRGRDREHPERVRARGRRVRRRDRRDRDRTRLPDPDRAPRPARVVRRDPDPASPGG